MQFVQHQFLFYFLPFALLLHRFAVSFNRGKVYGHVPRLTLFLLTLYFYGKKEPWWLIPFGICIVFDFIWARLLTKSESEKTRKIWLICSLCQNVILLGVFKYWDFLLENLALFPPLTAPLTALRQNVPISLPPGISFYTFESLSFVIDVYWRRITPPQSPLEFFGFIGMFPRFIAGPIVRYKEMVGQFANYPGMQLEKGFNLFAVGFILKCCFADQFNEWVSFAFEAPHANLISSWIGAVAYAMQIYFDFWGYSLMAIGLGRMLGFEFPANFEQPYTSKSIQEFWRRWHITLSTWLKDYLYVSLGGNRQGRIRTYRNLMITMLLGGLWHGANWTFVVWGAIHGAFLCFEKATGMRLGRVGTFLVVLFAWIFFRADSVSGAWAVLKNMGTYSGAASFTLPAAAFQISPANQILCTIGIFYVAVLEGRLNRLVYRVDNFLESRISWGLVLLCLVVPITESPKAIPFLYFQF